MPVLERIVGASTSQAIAYLFEKCEHPHLNHCEGCFRRVRPGPSECKEFAAAVDGSILLRFPSSNLVQLPAICWCQSPSKPTEFRSHRSGIEDLMAAKLTCWIAELSEDVTCWSLAKLTNQLTGSWWSWRGAWHRFVT